MHESQNALPDHGALFLALQSHFLISIVMTTLLMVVIFAMMMAVMTLHAQAAQVVAWPALDIYDQLQVSTNNDRVTTISATTKTSAALARQQAWVLSLNLSAYLAIGLCLHHGQQLPQGSSGGGNHRNPQAPCLQHVQEGVRHMHANVEVLVQKSSDDRNVRHDVKLLKCQRGGGEVAG